MERRDAVAENRRGAVRLRVPRGELYNGWCPGGSPRRGKEGRRSRDEGGQMKTKFAMRFAVMIVAMLLAAVFAASQNGPSASKPAGKSYAPPHTPDGQPDFQGIW